MDEKLRKALRRFKEKIQHDPVTGCDNWTGATAGRGYPCLQYNRKMWRAARWLYQNTVGEIPPDFEISHVCHNPLCVRIHPAHCTVEPHLFNMRRAAARGSFNGSRNGSARLTEEEVIAMRQLYAGSESFSVKRLSELFNVSLRTGYGIINYEVYENVIPDQESFGRLDRIPQTA